MSREVLVDDFRFNGIIKPALVGSAVDGPWCKDIDAALGTPTVQTLNGMMELTHTANNQAENIAFYHGDILSYDIDELVQVDIWAKITASINGAISAALGMASARNDVIQTIANRALFKLNGSNAVVIDTDDGTTEKLNIATGLSLSTTLRRFSIEFATGVQTKSAALSKGGKADVHFSMENASGLLRRVASDTVFDMSAYAGNLQPFFQLQKTAATAVATLSILRVRIAHRLKQ